MNSLLFIGPVATVGGPAIKNRILVEHLQKYAHVKVWNTYDKSVKARLGAIAAILFSRQKYMIAAVSRKGRNTLYPFLLLKHFLSGCRYSCVIIGGQVVESFKNKTSIKALSHADLVTVETDNAKKSLEDAFGLKNVHWMPNYKVFGEIIPRVDPASFRQATLRMIFLSSMRNMKGVRTLLEAFRICRKKGCNIELDYYGPIRKDFDQDLLTEIEHEDGVRYCGVVNNDEVLSVMSQYQIFAFPTEYPLEGFPAVLIEAQAAGLPIIASDINDNESIVKNGINGFIFPRGNIESLVEKIVYCEKNRNELIAISQQNIMDAKEYDAKKVINAYAEKLLETGWPI